MRKKQSVMAELFVELIIILFVVAVGIYGLSLLMPVLFPAVPK